MTKDNVKNLCETTKGKLKGVIEKTETFLNHHSLTQLNIDNDFEMEQFYRKILSDARHLLVFSEVSYEKLGICLRRPNFNLDYSEKVLFDVYHKCVNSFFYPKHECYAEDGRYAYTGQDAIRFRKKPSREIRNLILELSKIFEELREDLAFYETDYMTEKKLQGKSV
ncbi:YpuI family protein [Chengkuizengella axinellae]|uniref:YpuI family protein n=1 Tax=Chengkuizengella axinellae TaxID=3064388 RepID=A0ABT9IUU5_9BACL|nr:YpuI family protein [Chengkuizengella sp. 2205SS18-9]MDP5273111.1 YpuI family protein [Chengkuizengella sp. 2205SS18-9]